MDLTMPNVHWVCEAANCVWQYAMLIWSQASIAPAWNALAYQLMKQNMVWAGFFAAVAGMVVTLVVWLGSLTKNAEDKVLVVVLGVVVLAWAVAGVCHFVSLVVSPDLTLLERLAGLV